MVKRRDYREERRQREEAKFPKVKIRVNGRRKKPRPPRYHQPSAAITALLGIVISRRRRVSAPLRFYREVHYTIADIRDENIREYPYQNHLYWEWKTIWEWK